MRKLVLLGALVAVAVTASAATASTTTLTAHSSRFGTVLFDGSGRVLYVFGRDRGARSNCSGACAQAWPPFLTTTGAHAGAGVRAGLLGTTRRSDGTLQVTYAGHPLYYFHGDTKPGQIKCQNVENFGGLWLVVSPSGRPVK